MSIFRTRHYPERYILVGKILAHLLGVEIGSILGLNHVIDKDVNSCTYCCYITCTTLIEWEWGLPWLKSGATHYHAQLGLPDKGHAVIGLVVCNIWDVSSFKPAKQSSPTLLSTVPWGMNEELRKNFIEWVSLKNSRLLIIP